MIALLLRQWGRFNPRAIAGGEISKVNSSSLYRAVRMNSQQSPASVMGGAWAHGAMLGFVVRMLLYYGVLHAVYFLIPIAILHDQLYLQIFGRPSAGLIDLMVPAEEVTALANRIASPRATLEIVRGCDGSGVLFMISAAVVASRDMA